MRTYLVAAFAEGPFQGNPAGVCIVDSLADGGKLQRIAAELAQPETAFLCGAGDRWSVRWFSPQTEVALCGHATLAAAQALWWDGRAAGGGEIRFEAPDARLAARRGRDGLIWLDWPALPGERAAPPAELLACVDRPPVAAARHADRWLFEYAAAEAVLALRPDVPRLRATGVRSLIVTAPSADPAYDIVSRNFAPIVGVDEDQVTGMAHSCLAVHWRDRLGAALRCWQASRRGGAVRTRLRGERVGLGGRAVVEFAGDWVPA